MGYVGYPLDFGYFPCKNGLATAARLAAQGVPPYAASTAEMAVYAAHAAALRLLGATVAPARERTFHGVPVALGPAVVLAPSFCPCLTELRPKLPSPAQIVISERSTLLVDGAHIVIEQLELDGALEVGRPRCPRTTAAAREAARTATAREAARACARTAARTCDAPAMRLRCACYGSALAVHPLHPPHPTSPFPCAGARVRRRLAYDPQLARA